MRMDCGGVRVSPLPQKEASYVSDGPRGISPSAVHRQRELAVSSSLELVASFRVPAACDLPRGPTTSRRADCEAPPLGFLALIAAPASGVHPCAGYPTPRYVPSSAFRTPSTVCSATCLAGLFHPAATSRVCPPGDCPSRGAVPGFPGPFMPSWRWTRKACGMTRASPSRPRLQGFAPRGECGDERNLFRVPSAPRPSWALPPPGFPSTHRGNDFAFPPPTAFVRSEPAPTGPRCLDGAGRG
jgi:hypothetical protein